MIRSITLHKKKKIKALQEIEEIPGNTKIGNLKYHHYIWYLISSEQ